MDYALIGGNDFIRYAIVAALSFWLGIVLATWYMGRNYK